MTSEATPSKLTLPRHKRWISWLKSQKWLEIVGLAVALYALYDAVRAYELAKETGQLLVQVSGNLSTRYEGKFPDFMHRIPEVLGKANREIRIASDFAGYGIFTDHDGYVKIRTLLETKPTQSPRVEVRMVVLDPTGRRQQTQRRWGKEKLANLQSPGGKYHKQYQDFLRWSQCSEKITAMRQFTDCMDKEQDRAVESLGFLKGNLHLNPDLMPMYVWIADERAAVFAIPNFAQGGTEAAFSTEDPQLIAQLISLFETYYSPPHEPAAVAAGVSQTK